MSRVTISDIASKAGVSKGAVSYALNGKAGVSDETRARVQAIALELGWAPSRAARSLSRSRADTIGLVLSRPTRMLGLEPYYMEFIAGIESVIASRNVALMLHVVNHVDGEIATYRKWWSERRVDGVIMVDFSEPDRRIDVVRRLGIPAVCISSPATATGLSYVWTDDAAAMVEAVRYVRRLGHNRIARVAGIPNLSHILERNRAFLEAIDRAGLGPGLIIDTDFSGEAGARATRRLLTRDTPPTAIIYDNDIMAVAGLGVANEMGVQVPRELSLLAWDDSPLCEITHPPLSAMSRDVSRLGVHAAELLVAAIEGLAPEGRMGPTPFLLPRGSTSAPAEAVGDGG